MRTVGLAMLGAAALAGCSVGGDDGPGIAPSGSGTTRSYAADGFDTIELAGSDDVDFPGRPRRNSVGLRQHRRCRRQS